LILGIDLDGVVYDFCGHFARFINSYTGKSLDEMPAPKQWDFWHEWGLSFDEWFAHFNAFGNTGGFAVGGPVDGAVESLQVLATAGHRIAIVTARGCERGARPEQAEAVRLSTVQWLRTHAIPHHDICFTNNKTLIGADLFLDDASHHLKAIQEIGKRAVCFDQAHNRDWTGERVTSWKEFEQLCR